MVAFKLLLMKNLDNAYVFLLMLSFIWWLLTVRSSRTLFHPFSRNLSSSLHLFDLWQFLILKCMQCPKFTSLNFSRALDTLFLLMDMIYPITLCFPS